MCCSGAHGPLDVPGQGFHAWLPHAPLSGHCPACGKRRQKPHQIISYPAWASRRFADQCGVDDEAQWVCGPELTYVKQLRGIATCFLSSSMAVARNGSLTTPFNKARPAAHVQILAHVVLAGRPRPYRHMTMAPNQAVRCILESLCGRGSLPPVFLWAYLAVISFNRRRRFLHAILRRVLPCF